MSDQERQNFYMNSIERMRGGAIERMPWEHIRGLIGELSEGYPLFTNIITVEDTKIVRGRKLSSAELPEETSKLLYPPASMCKDYGRCNNPGSPVLYAAVGYELVFSELQAQIGDIFSLSFLKPKKELTALVLGALDIYRRTSGNCWLPDAMKAEAAKIRSDPRQICAILFDAFIADFFSREGSRDVYKVTSAFTDVIFRSVKEIDIIMYDSVDHKKGSCFAIRPEICDDQMVVTDVQLVRVTNHLGYGIYDFEEIAHSSKIDGRRIDWTK